MSTNIHVGIPPKQEGNPGWLLSGPSLWTQRQNCWFWKTQQFQMNSITSHSSLLPLPMLSQLSFHHPCYNLSLSSMTQFLPIHWQEMEKEPWPLHSNHSRRLHTARKLDLYYVSILVEMQRLSTKRKSKRKAKIENKLVGPLVTSKNKTRYSGT